MLEQDLKKIKASPKDYSFCPVCGKAYKKGTAERCLEDNEKLRAVCLDFKRCGKETPCTGSGHSANGDANSFGQEFCAYNEGKVPSGRFVGNKVGDKLTKQEKEARAKKARKTKEAKQLEEEQAEREKVMQRFSKIQGESDDRIWFMIQHKPTGKYLAEITLNNKNIPQTTSWAEIPGTYCMRSLEQRNMERLAKHMKDVEVVPMSGMTLRQVREENKQHGTE